jgi:hypothetical protein
MSVHEARPGPWSFSPTHAQDDQGSIPRTAGTKSPAPEGARPKPAHSGPHQQFTAAGAEIFGLSTQEPDYQREAASRLHLPYLLLTDTRLELTRAFRLPTFTATGMTLPGDCR